MPQVFKRKWVTKDGVERTSKAYYCRFQITGKDYLRSTGKARRSDALAEMHRIMDIARSGVSSERCFLDLQRSIDHRPEAEQSELRQGFARRLMQGIGEKLAVADVWDTWLKHPNSGNPSAITVKGYLGYWNRFKTWVDGEGIEYLHEVTPGHAENYASYLWGSGISPRTFNGHAKFLKSLFNVLRRVASVELNPFEDIRLRELFTESRRSFTVRELETVFSESKGDLRYLVALGVFTGMRMGDCVCLRWDEVDLKAGLIRHVPFKTRRKGKEVVVPVHAMLAPLLAKLRKTRRGKYLFPDLVKTYERDPSAISKMFSKFLQDQCRIKTNEAADSVTDQRKNAVSRVGFHSLRHSFVSLCAAEGVPQVVMQELVGHGSPAMTAIYSHANLEQRAAAIAGLPSFGIENGGKKKPTKKLKGKAKA